MPGHVPAMSVPYPHPMFGESTTTYVKDTFTDTDGTLLTAHTPDIDVLGSGWVDAAQGFMRVDGVNKCESQFNGGLAQIDPNVSDYTYTVDYETTTTTGATGEVHFRFTDASNTWVVRLYDLSGSQLMSLIEITAGAPTTRDSGVPVIAINTQYEIKIVTSGNSITVTFDGGTGLSYSSSVRNTVTPCGLKITNTQTRYDNLLITG